MSCPLTLLYTFQSDGLLAVPQHRHHVPTGKPGHRRIVDLQQNVTRMEAATEARRSTRGELTHERKVSVLRAAPHFQRRQLPLRVPAEDTLVDFFAPVVSPAF